MRMSAFDFILTNCFQGIKFKFKTCQVQPQNPSQAGVLRFHAITDENSRCSHNLHSCARQMERIYTEVIS